LSSVPAPPPDRELNQTAARYVILGVWAALIVLYVVLRSWRLTSYGLWVDEVFSVRVAQRSWRELFGLLTVDVVHPPFFYILLKLWIAGGGATLLWVKLLPVILAIGSLLPFWLLCRELKLSRTEATLTLWLMAVNGYLIHYSQELRMYSLLFCLSLWSLWLFVRFVDGRRASWRIVLPLFIVNVLLVYTHYFGWLLVGTEWLCVLLWRPRLLGWFSLSLGALAVAFAPWAYAVAAGSSKGNLQWIPRPGWAEGVWHVATLNGIMPWRHTTPVGLILFGAPIAFALVRALRDQQPPPRRLFAMLCVISFVPIVLAFVASQLLSQSVWGERHLIVVALPYLLVVALSLSCVRRVNWRVALIALVVAWTGAAGAAGVLAEGGRMPWKSLAQHLIEQEGPAPRKVTVYTFEGWAALPLEFLLADQGNHQFDVVLTQPKLMTGERFWVGFRDTTVRAGEDPRALLEQRGCRIDAERTAHDGGQRVILFRAIC